MSFCVAIKCDITCIVHDFSLEQLLLNKNNLSQIWYPDFNTHEVSTGDDESLCKSSRPFENLQCLLLGNCIPFSVLIFPDFHFLLKS